MARVGRSSNAHLEMGEMQKRIGRQDRRMKQATGRYAKSMLAATVALEPLPCSLSHTHRLFGGIPSDLERRPKPCFASQVG